MRSGHRSGSHSPERLKAFAQWMKASSTSTPMRERRDLAAHLAVREQLRIAHDAGPAVHAQRLLHPGDQEDEADVRVVQQVASCRPAADCPGGRGSAAAARRGPARSPARRPWARRRSARRRRTWPPARTASGRCRRGSARRACRCPWPAPAGSAALRLPSRSSASVATVFRNSSMVNSLSGQTAASQSNPAARAMHFHLFGSADPTGVSPGPRRQSYGFTLRAGLAALADVLEWNLGRRPQRAGGRAHHRPDRLRDRRSSVHGAAHRRRGATSGS